MGVLCVLACLLVSKFSLFYTVQYSTGIFYSTVGNNALNRHYGPTQYITIQYNTLHSTFLLKYSTFYMVDSKTEGVCSERTQRTILRSFSYNTLQYKILNLFAKILNLFYSLHVWDNVI